MTPRILQLALCALLATGAMSAKHWEGRHGNDDDHGHGHGNGHAKHADKRGHGDDDDDRGCRNCGYFRPDDRQTIVRYYGARQLPPGLRKKLYRTGRLPPGWERKIQPFPVVIERQLPPPPYGYVRGVIGNYAVVYNPRVRVIVDLFPLGR